MTTFSTASRARLRHASRTARVALRPHAPGPPGTLRRRATHRKRPGSQDPRRRWGGPPLLREVTLRRGSRPRHRTRAPPHRPLAATPSDHACKSGRPSSSRQASSRRAKITVKGARYARVARDGASATLDSDLPRRDPAPIRRTGPDPSAFETAIASAFKLARIASCDRYISNFCANSNSSPPATLVLQVARAASKFDDYAVGQAQRAAAGVGDRDLVEPPGAWWCCHGCGRPADLR